MRSCKLVAVAFVTLIFAIGACGTEEPPVVDERALACNPLGGPSCMMPWPSATYLRADAQSPTGYRVDIPPAAMPINADGIPIDSALYNEWDGFAIAAPILAAFETGVSADGLPGWQDPRASLMADSSIVVLDMDTGDRVAVFAEVDKNTDKPLERALIIRPLERMRSSTRYAVAIRKSVRAADGSPLPMRPAFAALVAGEDFDTPRWDTIAPRYAAIFAALEADGIARDDLVLAWDFVTASDEFITRDLLAMREQALPAMGANGANLSFDAEEVEGNPDRVHRLLIGTYDVPMFLTDGERDWSVLTRDAAGTPELVGTWRANFSAVIPKCVETEPLPRPVIIFGHGLFGNAEGYIDGGFLQQVANDHCVVIIGGDWIGLTNRQIATAAFAVNDLNKGIGITEKLAQAVINFIALGRIARGPFAESPMFQIDGERIIDSERLWYYGASLGGIMGGVFMAYDPDIVRGGLGVAGGPWSLLFERSLAWPPLRVAMKAAYDVNPFDYQQNLALMGWTFEKVDPLGVANRVIADPLPDTPPKQLLVYSAMGDTLVNNIASDVLTRSLDIPVCGPSLRVPFGVVEEVTPATSAMTIYDEGVEPWPPAVNVAPEDDNGTHGDVNERPAVQRQLHQFFESGEIRNECKLDGTPAPCDCATGACD